MFTLAKFASMMTQQPGSDLLPKGILVAAACKALVQMAADLLQLPVSTTAGPHSAFGGCFTAEGAADRVLTSNTDSRWLNCSAEGPTGSVSESDAALKQLLLLLVLHLQNQPHQDALLAVLLPACPALSCLGAAACSGLRSSKMHADTAQAQQQQWQSTRLLPTSSNSSRRLLPALRLWIQTAHLK